MNFLPITYFLPICCFPFLLYVLFCCKDILDSVIEWENEVRGGGLGVGEGADDWETLWVIRTHLSRSVCTLPNSHPPGPPLCSRGFPGGTNSKICLQCRRPWINPLGGEDPLEEEMATHSSIPASFVFPLGFPTEPLLGKEHLFLLPALISQVWQEKGTWPCS